jgi:hypothetical protein
MARIDAMTDTTIRGDSPEPWQTSWWVTMAAMYVFLPAGLYHMWRFRGWPLWLKWFSTLFGPAFAVLSFYLSQRWSIGPEIL